MFNKITKKVCTLPSTLALERKFSPARYLIMITSPNIDRECASAYISAAGLPVGQWPWFSLLLDTSNLGSSHRSNAVRTTRTSTCACVQYVHNTGTHFVRAPTFQRCRLLPKRRRQVERQQKHNIGYSYVQQVFGFYHFPFIPHLPANGSLNDVYIHRLQSKLPCYSERI